MIQSALIVLVCNEVFSYDSSHVEWSASMILVARRSWCLLLNRFSKLLLCSLYFLGTSEHLQGTVLPP